jgi:hypothetical protein
MEQSTGDRLCQPIFADAPESSHDPKDVLTISVFLDLLKEEEDYYPGEQDRTRLMITRLRKIFYDRWGWNSELIRGAAHIPGRYEVRIVDDPRAYKVHPKAAKKLKRYKAFEEQPKYRLVTYRKNDRVYGNTRAGQVPFIYQNDHQETLLPEGHYCDVAHILAGLDAANHPQVVSPLPAWISFLDKLFPHVDANIDIVTWLGDIASTSADFLFDWIRHHRVPLSNEELQQYINIDAPGSDMLGDIDAYVMHSCYPTGSEKAGRITDMLRDYFCGSGHSQIYRLRRFSIFCRSVGLQGWNGEGFSNEEKWLDYYQRQLRDNTAFQAYSLNEHGLKSLLVPLRIWLNGYRDELRTRYLLLIFLKTLKGLYKHEPRGN